jgi:hypothetical protein
MSGTGANSRSSSAGKKPPAEGEEEKPKRFQNGWSQELERLMADWSDIAMCYRWLHDNSDKIFHTRTLGISLPVIFLSTLSGFSNIGVQAILETPESKKYASFAIAGVSLMAGLLTTIGDRLRYAQLEEAHRVAAIAWGKFQRLITVELALNPNDRMDSLDFLKICRGELDRLIEQSPAIPKSSINLFNEKFGKINDLKKPDIVGALEHTRVFVSSETRLKQAAVDAALMLKHRKRALAELVTPQVENRIKSEIENRLADALESKKALLEQEIKQKQESAKKAQEEYEKVLEERKKKIEEEIEAEKRRLYREHNYEANASKGLGAQYEKRVQIPHDLYAKVNTRNSLTTPPPQERNQVIEPTSDVPGLQDESGDHIIIVGKK